MFYALQHAVPGATVVSDRREEVVLAGRLPHRRAGEVRERLARRYDAAIQVVECGTDAVEQDGLAESNCRQDDDRAGGRGGTTCRGGAVVLIPNPRGQMGERGSGATSLLHPRMTPLRATARQRSHFRSCRR